MPPTYSAAIGACGRATIPRQRPERLKLTKVLLDLDSVFNPVVAWRTRAGVEHVVEGLRFVLWGLRFRIRDGGDEFRFRCIANYSAFTQDFHVYEK